MNHREMEKSVNGHAGPVIPILDRAIAAGASDIHLRPERSPRIRVNTILNPLKDFFLTSEEILDFGKSFLTDYKLDELRDKGEVDASLGYRDRRFRANLFAQKDGYTLALRMIPMEIPSMEDLNLPEVLKDLCEKKRGLILVTGPTGSGKTTTLAAMINYINARRKENIVTIEDPIEYLYKEQESMISQRELGAHTRSFANALRASLRQDPDIILVGEMRDLDTISVALTAAETGHVVLSTLHTVGAANSMDRIIDVFPAHQQAQVRTQLSNVIEAVVSQQLMASISGQDPSDSFHPGRQRRPEDDHHGPRPGQSLPQGSDLQGYRPSVLGRPDSHQPGNRHASEERLSGNSLYLQSADIRGHCSSR